jgi:hypothetical protein
MSVARVEPVLSIAPTPQKIALQIEHAAPGLHVTIQRVNVAGRFATVVTRNGLMEDSEVSAILVEHFSFGWQALESDDFRCRFAVSSISADDRAKLMREVPIPEHIPHGRCDPNAESDSGPPGDVEAVRSQMGTGPLVPSVSVAGPFAVADWYGAGGGMDIFEKQRGTWRFIGGGGGAYGTTDMPRYGIPARYWCPLRLYDAKCPKK